MTKQENKFLKTPQYPGGKEALKKYFKENLIYPEVAKNKRVEGIVQLVAEINDNGLVEEVWIENGLGYGCDEEAIRLIKSAQFGQVKNRNVRVKAKKRFIIKFELPPEASVFYSLKENEKQLEKTVKRESYSYSIQVNKH